MQLNVHLKWVPVDIFLETASFPTLSKLCHFSCSPKRMMMCSADRCMSNINQPSQSNRLYKAKYDRNMLILKRQNSKRKERKSWKVEEVEGKFQSFTFYENKWITRDISKTHSKPSQTSKIKLFCKNINGWKPWTVFAKGYTLNVRIFLLLGMRCNFL